MGRENRFDQIVDGNMFIHQSGEHFSQTCCDCGSSHNIKCTVLNAEEIEVQMFKNQGLTKEARSIKGGHNGVLVSPEVYEPLMVLCKVMSKWPKGKLSKVQRQKLRRVAKEIMTVQEAFEKLVKSGDFLS